MCFHVSSICLNPTNVDFLCYRNLLSCITLFTVTKVDCTLRVLLFTLEVTFNFFQIPSV